eukprot:517613-Rhodomonas_salina.2
MSAAPHEDTSQTAEQKKTKGEKKEKGEKRKEIGKSVTLSRRALGSVLLLSSPGGAGSCARGI